MLFPVWPLPPQRTHDNPLVSPQVPFVSPPCPLHIPSTSLLDLHVRSMCPPTSPLYPPPMPHLRCGTQGSGDIRAQLRLRLWLGRVADSGDLPRHLEGTLRVYAETVSPRGRERPAG